MAFIFYPTTRLMILFKDLRISKEVLSENDFDFENNYSEIQKLKAVKLYSKSSRAPPFLLV